jgi:thiamine-monophosphate kinase
MKVAEIGEDRLLARLLRNIPVNRLVISGAGDDCAVVAPPTERELLLLKTDCVVEGIHFASDADAAAVGWKAMARPLSDFAAVAGRPRFALVTLLIDRATELSWVTKLYRGLRRAASRFGVAIVGGETSNTTGPKTISVTITGAAERERWVSRSGGKPGDALFVTGRLGGAIGGRHLRFVPRIDEARWLAEHFEIHAMMDLSDGLGTDLPRLARASGVGFELNHEALPRNRGCTIEQALSDGEDYELLFAVAPDTSDVLLRRWRKRWPLKLTRIGQLTKNATRRNALPSGYVHFT